MSSTESVFGSDTQPPGALAQAILAESSRTGIPPDLFAGIWRRETNRTFPNPWENGLGYGGEFGTRMSAAWGPTSAVRRVVEPPLQQQADTSGDILAAQLRAHGGDIAGALSSYSGGGYTQVPGEVTFGNINVPTPSSGSPQGGNLSGGGLSTSVSSGSSSSSSSSGGGLLGSLTSDVTGSIKEFLWRLFELAAGAVLIWLGMKQLGRVIGAPQQQPVTVNVEQPQVEAPQVIEDAQWEEVNNRELEAA